MSSAPSGRYQSKIFNFVHQRSRRLSEGCARAFRQLQVTASWSVQVLLYPVYLLLSTEQAALPSSKQHWPRPDADSQLSAPTADMPIQRVLLAADVLLEEPTATLQDRAKPLNLLGSNALMRLASLVQLKFLKTTYKNSFNHPSTLIPQPSNPATDRKRPIIQGIATQLSTCTLVLVTAQNEILDILTPQQQQRLQQRIIGEVAEYWRYWRLADVQPSIDPVNSLLPLQGRQQLRGWAQTALIALFTLPKKIAASLMQQESRLRSQAEAMDASPVAELELIVSPFQALTFLDRTVAGLESSVVPISQVAIALTQRSQVIQRLQQFSSWLGNAQFVSAPPDTASTADRTLRIQALIWRAIDYFFGDRHQRLGQTASQQTGLPHRQATQLPSNQPYLFVSADEDPWLTMSDLFEPPLVGLPVDQPQASVFPMSERQNILSGNDPIESIWQAIRKLSQHFFDTQFPQPPLARGAMSPSWQGEISTGQRFQPPQPPSGLAAQEGGTDVATQSRSQSSQIDHAPDWIETPATAIGYVKHPLEKLLEWLDRAMLWLEKILVGVWQWIVATR